VVEFRVYIGFSRLELGACAAIVVSELLRSSFLFDSFVCSPGADRLFAPVSTVNSRPVGAVPTGTDRY
jgi:hypothetical protein